MAHEHTDIIPPDLAPTLPALFRQRVRRSSGRCAYRYFDRNERRWTTVTWGEVERLASCWQDGLRREGLQAGDRVAIMLRNSLEWVLFDLASLGLGLVTVPLYVNDRPENVTFILEETGSRLLLIGGAPQWQRVRDTRYRLSDLSRIVSVVPVVEHERDDRLVELSRWLPEVASEYEAGVWDPDSLATIVYTSGTTGKPKGVMLSHRNILSNAYAGLCRVPVYPDDVLLSFLPLSHMLERTAGYYLSMMAGACVAHARSLDALSEDLPAVRPTIIVSVPRIFERAYKRIMARLADAPGWRRVLFNSTVNVGWRRFLYQQGRGAWSPFFPLWLLLHRHVAEHVLAAFGGRLRFAISGGAPLDLDVARIFIALGLPILQGYGLTETAPIVSVNTMDDNVPETVGRPLPGIEVRICDEQELLVGGPGVMMGYWRNEAATQAAIDQAGWFHTGDQASLDESGHITISGRIKEIIVLTNGEKVPPEDLEMAIAADPLFEQVLVIGEGRPYVSALVVLNEAEWNKLADQLAIDRSHWPAPRGRAIEQALLKRIERRVSRFPGYARIRRVRATPGPWELANGLVTATLKLRRKQLLTRFAEEIRGLYADH